MNMSKAIRRQLLCCDLIQGVIESCQESFQAAGRALPDDVRPLLHRLGLNLQRASIFACQRIGADGKWLLDVKATKQYGKSLGALQEALVKRYGLKVHAIDFCKGVQVWVEDIQTELPSAPAGRRTVWREIAEDMQALYSSYDPEFTADELIDAGMESGEMMKQASGVW
jgi:hypothetical protein